MSDGLLLRCQDVGLKSTSCENLAGTSGKLFFSPPADESSRILHTLNTSVTEPATLTREGAQKRPWETH